MRLVNDSLLVVTATKNTPSLFAMPRCNFDVVVLLLGIGAEINLDQNAATCTRLGIY
jgi:hypothetical protein